ncbi:MAG TPA: xylose isomerase, partial [Thermotoga naphthophila]|nr:xylose isomerase [Thermotoga petrophila]
SFKEGIGKEIVEGKTDFEKLEEYIIDKEDIELPSGKQEYLESLLNSYIVKTIAELR